MDGPSVNWRFFDLLVEDRKEGSPEAPDLLNTGSCGLHSVHNAFKTGAQNSGWYLDKLLKSLYHCFHDTPAQREDYTTTTGSSEFPKHFSTGLPLFPGKKIP